MELARLLGKFWSRRLRGTGDWRRNLECLIVQLKRRAKVKSGALWWLNRDDTLAVGKNDRVSHSPFVVFVHVDAAFGSQHLLQAFLCAWLGRCLIVSCGQ